MRILIAALLGLLWLVSPASAQVSPKHYLSAASNNSTLVLKGSVNGATVGLIQATNTTAVIYYLKLYNKATAPTCGTDVPVMTIALPVTSALPPIEPALGLLFPLGVGFCLVGGIADNDNTSAATGVTINIGVSGR